MIERVMQIADAYRIAKTPSRAELRRAELVRELQPEGLVALLDQATRTHPDRAIIEAALTILRVTIRGRT